MHDKELRSVGIGTGVGHGYGAAGILACYRLVGKFISRAPGSVASRITSLDHEARDDTMEDGAIVKLFLGQVDKIIGSEGRVFGV